MKIGFLSLPLAGHLNPMTTLARKLQSRGHEVVFIGRILNPLFAQPIWSSFRFAKMNTHWVL
jgi:hypothetical protein